MIIIGNANFLIIKSLTKSRTSLYLVQHFSVSMQFFWVWQATRKIMAFFCAIYKLLKCIIVHWWGLKTLKKFMQFKNASIHRRIQRKTSAKNYRDAKIKYFLWFIYEEGRAARNRNATDKKEDNKDTFGMKNLEKEKCYFVFHFLSELRN